MEFPKELKNPIQSGNFTFYDTSIEGVKVVDVKLFGDARGGFISGTVFDVAVDLREGSPTWGQWEGVVLSAENRRQFFVPRGFAHGFLVLSETAEFCYKCDDIYHPGDEGGIMWNDPELDIEWPAFFGEKTLDPAKVILSDKDKIHPALSSLKK